MENHWHANIKTGSNDQIQCKYIYLEIDNVLFSLEKPQRCSALLACHHYPLNLRIIEAGAALANISRMMDFQARATNVFGLKKKKKKEKTPPPRCSCGLWLMRHVRVRFVVTSLPVIQPFIEHCCPGAIGCSSQITLKRRLSWSTRTRCQRRREAKLIKTIICQKRLMLPFRTLGSRAPASKKVSRLKWGRCGDNLTLIFWKRRSDDLVCVAVTNRDGALPGLPVVLNRAFLLFVCVRDITLSEAGPSRKLG